MADQQTHPTHAEPTPPFPEQRQEPPGRAAEMEPLADHGEDSYVGHGRLTDKVALITGADSGIGRAVAIAFARESADLLCSYWKEDEDARTCWRCSTSQAAVPHMEPGSTIINTTSIQAA
jgi:hypothetical protein